MGRTILVVKYDGDFGLTIVSEYELYLTEPTDENIHWVFI